MMQPQKRMHPKPLMRLASLLRARTASSYAALLRRALHAARCAGQAARWQASPQKCATPQPEQAFSFSISSEVPSRFVHLEQHKHLKNDVNA